MAIGRMKSIAGIVAERILALLKCLLQRHSGSGIMRVTMRQKNGWLLAFPALALSLNLVIQTSSLTIPLAFLFSDPDAKAMTKGCDRKTCCTSLCYVDKNGAHHCVHKHEDSCGCKTSFKKTHLEPILHAAVATLPEVTPLLPVFLPSGWISQLPDLTVGCNPATPSPPPK